MALTISASGGGDFEIHPAGVYGARCTRIIDLGTQDTEYMGQAKKAKKIMLGFETTAVMTEGQYKGQPFLMTSRYTASLHEKAALRKLLQGWRGRPFTEAELAAFDLRNVLTKACLLNIVHDTNNGKTYANISSIMPLPATMPAPANTGNAIHFDLTEPDMKVFGALSPRLQEVIKSSHEWRDELKREEYDKGEMASAASVNDDDIPF